MKRRTRVGFSSILLMLFGYSSVALLLAFEVGGQVHLVLEIVKI